MKNMLFLFYLLCSGLYCQVPEWNDQKASQLSEMCISQKTETLIIYQNGEVRFSYGDSTKKYKIFSIRKSLVSLLYGIYSKEGKLDLNASLSQLQIDDVDGLTTEEKKATVLNLLQSKSGVYHSAAFETPGMINRRPERGSYLPGEFWFYNNWDFNALTTILEQEIRTPIFEAFDEIISKPLGLKDFEIEDQEYILEEGKSLHRATLWRLSGRDLLEIGLMLLNEGSVDGKQVVPKEWIQESVSEHSDLGMFGAYGLCWWVAKKGNHYPFVYFPEGTFSARGTGMQDLIIIPKYGMVIVHQTNVEGPDDEMMKVTDLGRMLKVIMDQN